jgi:hypothetical protein
VQWHLATFETGLGAVTGPGPRTLVTTGGRLAAAATWTATYPFLVFAGTFTRCESIEFQHGLILHLDEMLYLVTVLYSFVSPKPVSVAWTVFVLPMALFTCV